MKKPLLIVKLGSTFDDLKKRKGDFETWVAQRTNLLDDRLQFCDPLAGDTFPAPYNFAGIILTGSHAMVTERREWSEKTAAWLRTLAVNQIPILGICYGHQLLAEAFGGKVVDNPNGREFGTVTISKNGADEDMLFKNVPVEFPAHVCHTQSVGLLPPGAVLLAASEMDPVQAFFLPPCTWGVQFHPEFDEEAIRFYVDKNADSLSAEGQDVRELRGAIRQTPASERLIADFCQLASDWQGSKSKLESA